MNPLDAREAEEAYEYPARPYTLPMRPVQSFRVLSESGDVPTAQTTETTGYHSPTMIEIIGGPPVTSWTPETEDTLNKDWDNYLAGRWLDEVDDEAWSDKYLTAEDARVLRQDGV